MEDLGEFDILHLPTRGFHHRKTFCGETFALPYNHF